MFLPTTPYFASYLKITFLRLTRKTFGAPVNCIVYKGNNKLTEPVTATLSEVLTYLLFQILFRRGARRVGEGARERGLCA